MVTLRSSTQEKKDCQRRDSDCPCVVPPHLEKRIGLAGVLTRAPSLVNPERNMVAAFYLASLLCASYVPAAPRGAPLRAASRVAAPMMMPIGVPKVAYRVPGSAYADWVSNLLPQRAARFSSSSIIVSFSIFAAKLSADTTSSVVPLADDAHPSARCTGGSLQPLVPRAHPLPWSGDQ